MDLPGVNLSEVSAFCAATRSTQNTGMGPQHVLTAYAVLHKIALDPLSWVFRRQ